MAGPRVVVVAADPDPDFDLAARLLGRSDFPRDRVVGAPSLWRDGLPVVEVNAWLRYRRHEVGAGTLSDDADLLRRWVAFLAGRGTAVHDATEADYRAFESMLRDPRRAQDGSRLKPVTDGYWANLRSKVAMFHEWLARMLGWPSPVPVRVDPTTGQKRYRGRRTIRSAPDVVPLTPDAFDLLCAAFHRRAPTGQERYAARREAALAQWLVATGQRISTAVHMTVYEVPPPSHRTLAAVGVPSTLDEDEQEGTAPAGSSMEAIRTPASITKNNRAVLHHGLSGRLDVVRDYVVGDRDLDAARGWQPNNPLRVIEANALAVTFVHDNSAQVETGRRWNTVSADERTRMIDQHGRSAMMFLTQTGAPWQVGSARNAIGNAAAHARRADPTFPVGVHPHSLRHTYAVWVAMLRVMRDEDAGYAHLDMTREAIVTHTARQLGHAAPTDRQGVTDIYLAFLEEMLLDPTITADRIKGVA